MSDYPPRCNCDKTKVKVYLDYTNTIEGQLIIDHEVPLRPGEHPEGNEWNGGVSIERRWKTPSGAEKQDFVVLNFTEAEKVRDALSAYIWDHS